MAARICKQDQIEVRCINDFLRYIDPYEDKATLFSQMKTGGVSTLLTKTNENNAKCKYRLGDDDNH
jgi:hypothetical protein